MVARRLTMNAARSPTGHTESTHHRRGEAKRQAVTIEQVVENTG